jgi:hypothetical protein
LISTHFLEESKLLVINVGGPSQSVHGVTSLTLSQILSDFQVGVDAGLSNNLHCVDVEDQELVTVQCLLLLVDEWKEFDALSHVVECLERKVDMMILLV